MRTIIAGSREFTDYEVVKKAIEEGQKKLGKITKILHGDARGVDKLGEQWAIENKIPFKKFPADWKNIKRQGAKVKERKNPWTGKMEKYDYMAGVFRNELMAAEADALIAIDLNTPGTNSMIELAEKYGLKIYIYEPKKEKIKF